MLDSKSDKGCATPKRGATHQPEVNPHKQTKRTAQSHVEARGSSQCTGTSEVHHGVWQPCTPRSQSTIRFTTQKLVHHEETITDTLEEIIADQEQVAFLVTETRGNM